MSEVKERFTPIFFVSYLGFGKKRLLPTVAVVEDLRVVPAMDENALDVFVGTANENKNPLKLESLLISMNKSDTRDSFVCFVSTAFHLTQCTSSETP